MIEEVSLGMKLLGFAKRYWLYIALALAVAAAIGFAIHHHSSAKKAFGDERFKAGYAAAVADAKAAQVKANTQATKINTGIRKDSDETAGSITRDRDNLRLHNDPGKAACPAAAPSGAGRPVAPARPGNVAVAEVPDVGGQPLVALPLDDAIRFAGQCDLNRNEAARWRQSDAALNAAATASQKESNQ